MNQLDFTSGLDYLWALMPETVLSTAAILILVYDGFAGRSADASHLRRVGWMSFVAIGLAVVANFWLLRFEETGSTTMIAIDGFRFFTNFLFLGAAALTILLSLDYVVRERIDRGEFYVLLLFATVGMMLLAGSRDLIIIFLGFELMSVASYVLAGFKLRDPRSSEAALKYFLLGAFSSAFLLYGMALVFGAARTTNLGLLYLTIQSGQVEVLLIAGIALMAVGFGFKVSAVPFHVWTPDAYEGAPTPITAFLAAAIKAAAFAAFIRIFVVGLGGLYEYWAEIVWWLAALTMIVPNLIALVQDNVKRLLAYSSIAHAGYLLVALVAANESGVAAFLFYLVAYTVMIMGAFGIVLMLAGPGDQRQSVFDYAGIGWTHPWAAAALSLFLVSLAGLPPTGGFVAKLYVLRASVESGYPNLAVILAVTTLISYWYYLRIIVTMYMKPSTAPLVRLVWSRALRGALAFCAIVTVFMGVLPSWPLLKAQQSVEGMTRVAERAVDSGPVANRK